MITLVRSGVAWSVGLGLGLAVIAALLWSPLLQPASVVGKDLDEAASNHSLEPVATPVPRGGSSASASKNEDVVARTVTAGYWALS